MNLLTTYAALARAVPGARVERRPHYLISSGPEEFSICNFAAGFDLNGTEAEAVAMCKALRASTRSSQFWVFHGSGDSPANLDHPLAEAGFVYRNELVHMAADADEAAHAGWTPVPAVGEDGRLATAGFMVSQFFFRSDAPTRSRLTETTARARTELYGVHAGEKPVGAVMLSPSGSVLGLYNLCVREDLRRSGIGSDLVRWVLRSAHVRGCEGVVLQCDSSLVAWYKSLGFAAIGRVSVYGLARVSRFR